MIAILRIDAKESPRLLVLDEQDAAAPLVDDARLHIEILPGKHTLSLANTSAAADRVYRVVFPDGLTGEARIFEVGRRSNAIVRDVTVIANVVAPAPVTPREGADGAVEVDASADSSLLQ